MNTQNTTTAPPQTTASTPTPEIALDQIENLCSDQAFTENTQPVAPSDSPYADPLRSGWTYVRWTGNAFISWIAILVGSAVLFGPTFDSIAVILSGGTNFAWHASMFSFLAVTALFGFLNGRERIPQKRLYITLGAGLLMLVFGSITIFLRPQSEWLYGVAVIAAQLLTFAGAVYCGMQIPECEKVTPQKGFLMKCVSQGGGILSIFAMVIAFKFGSAYLSSMAEGTMHNGKAAPTTQYVDFENNPFAFKDYEGKVVLVEFWAPWCGPCVAAMPHLCELQEQYGKRDDFAIVSIAVSSSHDTAKKTFEKKGCDWQLLFRPETDTNDAEPDSPKEDSLAENQSPEFQPKGIPSAYIIDRDGKVIAAGIRGSAIDAKLEELLGGDSH